MADDETSGSLSKAAQLLQKLIRPALAVITTVLPWAIDTTTKLYNIYIRLPVNVAQFLIGFVFCFFGGLYPSLFAAIQAAKVSGWSTLTNALGDLKDEALVVLEASKKDDDADEDNDGVADVDQISDKALLMRKVNLVLTKVNPSKVDQAISSIYTIWVSVIATLTIEFARTVALAASISDFLKKPTTHFIAPIIRAVTPKEYQRWIPVVLGWVIKSIAMSIAWYIQAIISAFASALEGGLVMSRSLMNICIGKGIKLGGLIPDRHEDTHIDEYCSYIFAALGFYFQFKLGFDVPFPFNVVLLPFEVAETYIRWCVTKVE